VIVNFNAKLFLVIGVIMMLVTAIAIELFLCPHHSHKTKADLQPTPIEVIDTAPETSAIQYKQITQWISEVPELKPIMIQSFSDKKITEAEFQNIYVEMMKIKEQKNIEPHKQTIQEFIDDTEDDHGEFKILLPSSIP